MTGSGDFSRHKSPCSLCRKRRQACYAGPAGVSGPCKRCSAEGAQCDLARIINSSAELATQMSRLQRMIEELEEREDEQSQLASKTSRALDVDDLIAPMTRLCFDGTTVSKQPLPKAEMVRHAQIYLDGDGARPSGFIYDPPGSTKRSLDDLRAAMLPKDSFMALLDEWTSMFSLFQGPVYAPTWPGRVAAQFERGDMQADELAELFAVLSVITGEKALSAGYSYPQQHAISDQWGNYARSALELADWGERPTITSTRASFWLVTLAIAFSKSTQHFEAGLAQLDLTIRSMFKLGLNVPPSPDMLATEAYEWQGLAISLLCIECVSIPYVFGLSPMFVSSWSYNTSFGRSSYASPDLIFVDVPAALTDADLPEELHNHPFRVPETIIQGYYARQQVVKMRYRVHKDVFHNGNAHVSVSYETVKKYLAELEDIEQELVDPKWTVRRRTDSFGYEFVEPVVDWGTRLARGWCMPVLHKLALALHRPFIGHRVYRGSEVVDADWHIREFIRRIRQLEVYDEERKAHMGPMVIVAFAGLESLVGLALICILRPDNADSRELWIRMSTRIAKLTDSATIRERLSRLIAFLLASEDERRRKSAALSLPSGKRARLSDGGSAPGQGTFSSTEVEERRPDDSGDPSPDSRISTPGSSAESASVDPSLWPELPVFDTLDLLSRLPQPSTDFSFELPYLAS